MVLAVDVNRILRAESRILDVGATGPELAATLAARGYERYLGLVRPSLVGDVRARAGATAHRFHPLSSPSQVFRCSADVLVLRAPFHRLLWPLRDLRHLEFILVEVGSRIPSPDFVAARVMGRATRNLTPAGTVSLAGQRFAVLKVPTVRPNRPRLYLSEVLGVGGLIRRLNDEGHRYVALRWFDSLPDLQPGEDLDLLVADGDLAAVRGILDEEPGTIAVDLYSETGLPGSDYQGAAYYVPDLARKILAGVVGHDSGCRVPSPIDHLHSLAYHAVYHKGELSGLPPTGDLAQPPDPDADHDYGATLQLLAGAVGVDLDVSLEGLDAYLGRQGWRPPPDALRRLADSNAWVARQLRVDVLRPAEPPELSVFLVRERALTVVAMAEIEEVLESARFEVVCTSSLDDAARRRCADLTRGGNWGAGPFPVSGGGPVAALAALHYGPQPPDPIAQRQYPRLTNADVLLAKQRIRDLIGARVDPARRFNPVHSSDNEPEAWEYVDAALSDRAAELAAVVADRRAAYRTEVPVRRELSRGHRAKVEVVDGPGGLVVRKTFAPRARAFMERELRALNELAGSVDAVPDLVAVGPNWFACPYFDHTLVDLDGRSGQLLPLRLIRQMVNVLREIHDLGFDLIDAKPQNFVLDPRAGLKIVDFEFFYSYPHAPPRFAESYWLRGVPPDFLGEVPAGSLSYDWRWRRYTGLSPEALVSGAPWRQHLERAVHRVRRVAIGPRSLPRRLARGARSRVRWSRGRLASRYWGWARARAWTSGTDR